MGRIALLLFLCLSVLHCSKGQKDYSQTPAPVNEGQLGLIVTATTANLDQISEKYPDARIRTVSAAQNIFEISNVTEGDLAHIVGNQQMQKNFFVQASDYKDKELTLKSVLKDAATETRNALNSCREGKFKPELSALDLSYDINSLTITLGESVKITAAAKANANVGGEARLLWALAPPMLSRQEFSQVIASEQSFTPDSVGFYRIALIAQGKDLVCDVTLIPLFVTANPKPNHDLTLGGTPDVTKFSQLMDISALDAWTMAKGKGMIVAVIDSGLNYNHPGIRDNIALKESELLDNADNDNNGKSDDFMGWDFINGDNLPFDDEGHGSHVSGLIASPIMGVAPEAKILPVKAINAAGGSDLGTILAGIYYAVDNGAKIINASIGLGNIPPQQQKLFKEALDYAASKNVLFLSAAGNGDNAGNGYDIEMLPEYPASFTGDNLVTVASTTVGGKLSKYSNFSKHLVQIAAPGGDGRDMLYSLATMNPHNLAIIGMVGTSMATPVAAGVSALIWGTNPSMTALQVKTILLENGTDLPALKDTTLTGKQVNAKLAVQKALDLQPVLATN